MHAPPRSFVRVRCLDEQYSFDLFEGAEVTVGRDRHRADVVVPHLAIALLHLRFGNIGGKCFVEDLDTRGGFTLNRERVGGRHELSLGDQVMLLTEVVFVVEQGQ